MAWAVVQRPAAIIKLYKPTSTHKKCIRWNEAAHDLIGRPIYATVLYDASTKKLAIRQGHSSGGDLLVIETHDELRYEIYADAVYTAAGIVLADDTEFTPQAFTYGEEDPEPAALVTAVWIQLP